MSTNKNKQIILTQKQIYACVQDIISSICDEFGTKRINDIAFIGIQQKGVPLAEKIQDGIEKKRKIRPPLGKIDISMYRDDIGTGRKISKTHETDIPFDIEDKIIILVDDVLHTGRTIRAALDAITDYGRPSMIRLAVLIDRGGREFPIGADYTGLTKKIDAAYKISVVWNSYGEGDSVLLYRKSKTEK